MHFLNLLKGNETSLPFIVSAVCSSNFDLEWPHFNLTATLDGTQGDGEWGLEQKKHGGWHLQKAPVSKGQVVSPWVCKKHSASLLLFNFQGHQRITGKF